MKRTLAVLLILAGLGAYVYFFEIKAKAKQEAAERREKRLVTLEQLDIDRIELSNEYGEIVLVKENDTWRLDKPVNAPADDGAVRQLLGALSSAESKGSIADAGGLGAFGLDRPKTSITLSAGGKTETVRVGKRSPVSNDLYVQRGDQQVVYQTAAAIEGAAIKKADEFREKRLFRFAAADVTEMTIVNEGKTLELKRDGNDWRITAPASLNADDGIAQGLASDLASLRATAWLAEEADAKALATHQLSKPAGRVAVKLTDGNTFALRIGAMAGGDRAAQVEGLPQVVTIAEWSAKNLLKSDLELRERKLVEVAGADVSKMVFQHGATTTTYTRSGADWSVGENVSKPADEEKTNELLLNITGLRATEWHRSTPQTRRDHGLVKPERRIVLYDIDGKELAQLNFGADESSWAVWAQTADKSVEAKVPNDLVKSLWPTGAE